MASKRLAARHPELMTLAALALFGLGLCWVAYLLPSNAERWRRGAMHRDADLAELMASRVQGASVRESLALLGEPDRSRDHTLAYDVADGCATLLSIDGCALVLSVERGRIVGARLDDLGAPPGRGSRCVAGVCPR